MTPTLNPYLKWAIAALVPAFATGSALLAAGIDPHAFSFWWGVGGSFVGGLLGKTMSVGGDNAVQKKSQ